MNCPCAEKLEMVSASSARGAVAIDTATIASIKHGDAHRALLTTAKGRLGRQKETYYGQRALVETAMGR